MTAPDDSDRDLFARIYDDLRAMAVLYLKKEPGGHTLQATALVHEAWLRLPPGPEVEGGKPRFLSMAARAMRTILIDHARGKKRSKRGGGADRIPLWEADEGHEPLSVDLLDLDEKLTELATIDARKAKVVELRFFAGLNVKEVAETLGVHFRTIEMDWLAARVWLGAALSD